MCTHFVILPSFINKKHQMLGLISEIELDLLNEFASCVSQVSTS